MCPFTCTFTLLLSTTAEEPQKQQRKGALSKLPEIPSGPSLVLLCCSAVCGHAFITFIDKADSANVPQHREVERTLSATSSFSVLQKQDKTSSAIQAHYLGTLLCHQHCSITNKQKKKKGHFCRGMFKYTACRLQKECLNTIVKGNLISYSCPRSDFCLVGHHICVPQ